MKIEPVIPRVTRLPNGSLYEVYRREYGGGPGYIYRKDNKVVLRTCYAEKVRGREFLKDHMTVINLDPFYVKVKNATGWKAEKNVYYVIRDLNTTVSCKDALPSAEELVALLCPNLVDRVKEDSSTMLHYFLRPLWSGSLKEGLVKLLGTKGKMAQAVLSLYLNGHEMPLRMMAHLKGLVTPEVAFAFGMLYVHTPVGKNKHTRSLFIRVNPNLFRKKKPFTHMSDTLYMFCKLFAVKKHRAEHIVGLDRFSTWEELHDYLSLAQHKVLQSKRKTKYKHTRIQLEALPEDVDGWSIRLPAEANDVLEWGFKMKHCIGGYASHHNRSCVLLGMYLDDELKYNIMLSQFGAVTQFYGYRNCSPSEEEWKLFNNMLPLKARRALASKLN
jgi:hypothetical protein